MFSVLKFRIEIVPILLTTFAVGAEDSAEGIAFFESKIRPVLAEKCYSCHSAEAEKLKGGFRLDTRNGIRKGGDIGGAVIPGNPKASLLLKAIGYHDSDLEMPPKERLPETVVADFEKWIAMGAPDPRADGDAAKVSSPEIDIEEGRKHWSFQPVKNPKPPSVKSKWPKTDVDRFVLAELNKNGLRPVADATAVTLLRRISFDLTGLPPAAEEVRRFVNLKPGEVEVELESVIGKLIDSREFGERWGRHWLDVARYADSSGGSHNLPYPVAFRYRDYVVDAFCKDKPYDQFLQEQLAGDLLPAKNTEQRNEQLTATGFLCVGVKDLRERKNLRYTMAIVEEQIDTVGRSMLGLTLACAKCHDHKFDPIPTEDYYALAGILRSSEPQIGAWRNRHKDPLTARLQILEERPASFSDEDMAEFLKQDVDMVPILLGIRDEKRRLLIEAGLQDAGKKEQEIFTAKQPSMLKLEAQLAAAETEFDKLLSRYEEALPHSVMAMRDRPEPGDCEVHIRGDEKAPGKVIPRGFPAVLTNAATPKVNTKQSGRLALANWIASRENPLTARVMVNRVWLQLFGAGLVDTPDDFGKTGQIPSNPALLDHLATRFVEEGWSVKSLIRYLMNRRSYRLSTGHDPKAHELDPANRLTWRMSKRRLDANAILDSLRLIGGQLQSGPPADPYIHPRERDSRLKVIDKITWAANAEGRRSIYQPLWRDYIPADLMVFDFPEPSLVVGKRDLTTVPTQALYLMNSPLVAEYARDVAQKIEAQTRDHAAFVEMAFLTILNRPGKAEELNDGLEFLAKFKTAAKLEDVKFSAPAAFCQSLIASAEFRYLF